MGNSGLRHMGNQPAQDPRTYFQTDLPNFIYQDRIGNGKFMKTYIVKVKGVPFVVKVYMKAADENLQSVSLELSNLWKTISPSRYPNLLPYQMWIKSAKPTRNNVYPVYLIRQYMQSSLHDRLSTRPFLTQVEKLWLMYQLFKALEVCHMSHGIIHGDIKPENVMCTSWNWLVLTDFGTFKPANLPDDDPTDFQFYFDTMGRNSCYIAPERFYRREVKNNPGDAQADSPVDSAAKVAAQQLTSAIDVFSLGCTLAEIFLDGEKFILLPGMLQYVGTSGAKKIARTGGLERLDQEDSPVRAALNKISSKLVRDVIIDMTQRRPDLRTNVRNYRHILEGRRPPSSMVTQGGAIGQRVVEMEKPASSAPFPEFFAQTVYPVFQKLHTHGITPDDRIIILCENYDAILAGITGQEDPEGLAFFKHSVKGIIGARTQSSIDAGGMNAFSAFGGKSSGNENEALPFHPDALPAARLRPHDLMGPLLSAPWSAMPVQWAAKNAAAIKNTENAPSLSINPNLDLAIDELMEHCQELIDRMDTNKPKPYNGPSSQSMPAAGTASSGLFGKSNASSSSSASAAGLASAALKASYGIDTLMHAQVNPGFSSTIPLLDRPLQSSFGEPNERLMHEGMLLPVQVVCASFRSLKFPHAKIVAIMLLVRLGSMCEDDVILHRIVPTLLQAVGDLVAQVRAAAVRALCSLLALVRNVDAIESNLFPQYLFPELSTRIARELEPIVRVAFAECAGRYAETSKRFLDQAHLAAQSKTLSGDFDTDESNVGGKGGAKVKDSTPLVAFQYDAKLRALHDHVNLWIKELLLDSSRAGLAQGRQVNRKATTRKRPTFSGSLDTLVHSSSVIRRVLLVDVVRLCAFFGHDALDVLLQHVLTFLNDADWEVRYAFCAKIASICAFVGPTVTIERILPCIENALYDVEERVAVRAVQCLSTLVQLGLVSAVSVLVEIAKLVVPLVLHPRANVRSAAITAFASALSVANIADAVVFLLPLLRPVQLMELPGGDLSKEALRKMLTGPVSYASFNAAIYDQLKQYKSSSNNQLVTSGKLVATPVSKGTSVEDSGTALSLDDLKLHSYSGTVVDPSDKIKLTVLVKYIDGLAREINAKSNLLRSANSNTTSRDPVTQSPANNTNATSNSTIKILQESDLELVTINMSECIEDSLLVPHQKGDGRFFANFSSEQSRRVLINNPAAIRSLKKIRACYGLYSQESAKRALTSGVLPEPILDTDSSDGPSKAASPLQRKPNGLGKQTSEMMLGADATTDDNSSADTQTLLRRIKALALPPLPPDVGSLSSPEERRLDPAEIPDPNARLTWRPRENTLVASLQEHSLGVNQLAVAPDLVFFASASSDSTVKIWRVRGIDKAPVARSALTYRKHQGAVTSVAVLENSHSVASASEDGSVHVWRVDSVSELPPLGSTDRDSEGARYAVPCSSEIRQLQPSEGAVVAVSHYSSDVASVVTYLTQNGGLHAWDLRASREAFQFGVRPELGQATAMAMAPDRNWICVGTTHGFVSLWDIRFNTQAKLWRHSSSGPIHRLASCKSLPGVTPQMQQKAYATRSEHLIGSAEGAYLFVAAGNNEAAVWALPEGGECLKCFRSIPLRASRQPLAPLPILREVNLPRHPLSPIFSAVDNYGVKKFGPADVGPTYNPLENSYRSVLGRISEKGASYLITAGTDRVIRYWDFSSPTKCFTVSGLLPCQPRPAYETPMSEGLLGKLFLSFDAATPSADVVSQSDLPRREGRGPLPPSSNFKDAILDLKSIDVPVRLLMAASRDGDIKLWR